jgi:hypothetical protein
MPNGVWIGGLKHSVVNREVETGANGEISFLVLVTARRGERGHISVASDSKGEKKSVIIVAGYEKSAGCTSAMARSVAVDFCKWCVEQGVDQS